MTTTVLPGSTRAPSSSAVRVTRDIPYGEASVGVDAEHGGRMRALLLDVYEPAAPNDSGRPRPAVVMAFGGAFHRGSKESDCFESGGLRNTSVADYCRQFAEWGYVAFSVDYRLVPEDPGPGATPAVLSPSRIPRSRVDTVRQLLGLAPATDDELWRGIEAASDDVAAAIRFVRAEAHRWAIDAERVVVGGFSAGARTAINAALAEQVPVAGIVSLSGYIGDDDLAHHLKTMQTKPAFLLVHGENDLDYVATAAPKIVARLAEAGFECRDIVVPAAGHFYPALAAARDAAGASTTVLDAIAGFLQSRFRADRERQL